MSADNKDKSVFEALPIKVLQNIVSYFNILDYINFFATSKRINKMIGMNPELLENLPLRLQLRNKTNFQEVKKRLKVDRRYSFVQFVHSSFNKNSAIWLTSPMCSNMKKLLLCNVLFDFNDNKLIRKTLSSLHNLENIAFAECQMEGFDYSKKSEVNAVVMDKLKVINCVSSSIELLLFIKSPNLNSLKISETQSDDDTLAIIMVFLGEQKLENLENLALWDLKFTKKYQIKKEHIQSMNFPLRNLSLQRLTTPFENKEDFVAFLMRFQETLHELDVEKLNSGIAYEWIFCKSNKLKTLRMTIHEIPKALMSNLMPNTTITKLIIKEELKGKRKLNGLVEVLSKLPNLEILMAIKCDEKVLASIMANCKELKTLRVSNFIDPDKTFSNGNIRLPSVTKLSICTIENYTAKNWRAICHAFPDLEALAVHFTDKKSLREPAINAITMGLKNARHFIFGKGFQAKKVIFDKLLQNCNNLQTVEILQCAFKTPEIADDIKNDFQKPGLRFICYSPETSVCNEIEGNQVCEFWKEYAESDDEDSDFEIDLLFGLIHLSVEAAIQANRFRQDNYEDDDEEENNDGAGGGDIAHELD